MGMIMGKLWEDHGKIWEKSQGYWKSLRSKWMESVSEAPIFDGEKSMVSG